MWILPHRGKSIYPNYCVNNTAIHNYCGLEKKHNRSRSHQGLLKACTSLCSGITPLKSMGICLSKDDNPGVKISIASLQTISRTRSDYSSSAKGKAMLSHFKIRGGLRGLPSLLQHHGTSLLIVFRSPLFPFTCVH